MLNAAGRACPKCGAPISFGRVAFGNETHAFVCAQCRARLMKKTMRTGTLLAAVAIGLLVMLQYGWGAWQTWGVIAGLMAIVFVWSMMVVRVRLADPQDPDPPKQA